MNLFAHCDGLLLLCEKLFLKNLIEKMPTFLQWIYTMFFVVVGWVLFNLTDFAELKDALSLMFSFVSTDWAALLAADTSIVFSLLFVLPAAVFSFPIFKKLKANDKSIIATVAVNACCFILLAACIVCIISSAYNPFIYFRF